VKAAVRATPTTAEVVRVPKPPRVRVPSGFGTNVPDRVPEPEKEAAETGFGMKVPDKVPEPVRKSFGETPPLG